MSVRLWDVEAPTSWRSVHRWRWDFQPYAPATLYPPSEDSWYSVALEAESTPGPWCGCVATFGRSVLPRLPTWGVVPRLPIWGVFPRLPIWGVLPRLPTWGVLPRLPTWGVVPRLPIWGVFPRLPIWGVLPRLPTWSVLPRLPLCKQNQPLVDLCFTAICQAGFRCMQVLVKLWGGGGVSRACSMEITPGIPQISYSSACKWDATVFVRSAWVATSCSKANAKATTRRSYCRGRDM
jgi:hypothetical protein